MGGDQLVIGLEEAGTLPLKTNSFPTWQFLRPQNEHPVKGDMLMPNPLPSHWLSCSGQAPVVPMAANGAREGPWPLVPVWGTTQARVQMCLNEQGHHQGPRYM